MVDVDVPSSRTRQQAYSLLQPLATAIGMRFGSVVSIMIAAPLMEDGGVDTIQYVFSRVFVLCFGR